jgi:hypothetical protein
VPGSIVFVHGTGVRLSSYATSYGIAQSAAKAAGLEQHFVECAWGDPLGVQFEGRSLPDEPTPEDLLREDEDLRRWSWLFGDPTAELDLLTIRDSSRSRAPGPPDRIPPWEALLNRIKAYSPSSELQLLLQRGGLISFWRDAWEEILQLSVTREAFRASEAELPEAGQALARALIAQLHILALNHSQPGPNRTLRNQLVDRLTRDWEVNVYGAGAFFAKHLKRRATHLLRGRRNQFTSSITLPAGDILLYQSRGEDVRRFILSKILAAAPPVILFGHSLGGVACFDLLVRIRVPEVTHLVTVGSQVPFLYEIGALNSLKMPEPLPRGFQPWLNIFDSDDFLSFVAERLFPDAVDFRTQSGQPFPASHSAYSGNPEVWQKVLTFTRS